jgi:hypothetical protein
MNKNPPPPEVGDVFEGPEIGHGVPVRTMRKGRYYVRAVVDAFEDDEYGWIYQVVFRFHTRHKGWRYEIVSAHAIGLGLYRKISKAKRKKAS